MAVLFFVPKKEEMRLKMPREMELDIICPICNRYIKTYKGWGWTSITAKCKKCNKIVKYDEENKNFAIIRTPERSSSGMTFY